jgi:hypothetical protein
MQIHYGCITDGLQYAHGVVFSYPLSKREREIKNILGKKIVWNSKNVRRGGPPDRTEDNGRSWERCSPLFCVQTWKYIRRRGRKCQIKKGLYIPSDESLQKVPLAEFI